MEPLSSATIRHLSQLARLQITEEEAGRYTTQLSSVVEYVEQLQKLNLTTDQAVPSTQYNVLAADTPRTQADPLTVPTDQLIAAAPLHVGRLLEVRAVLGGEEAA